MTNDQRDEKINETHADVRVIKSEMTHITGWIGDHEETHKEIKKGLHSKIWDVMKMVIAAMLGAAGIFGAKEL